MKHPHDNNGGDRTVRLKQLRPPLNNILHDRFGARGRLAQFLHMDCLKASASQVNLLHEFTHDWLLFHSTHSPNCQRKIVIQKLILLLSNTPAYDALLKNTPSDPNPLLAYINHCQIERNDAAIRALLEAYLDAQAIVEKEHQNAKTAFQAIPHERVLKRLWHPWRQFTDAMIRKPKKKRLRGWWFSRRRLQPTPLPAQKALTAQTVDPRQAHLEKHILNNSDDQF